MRCVFWVFVATLIALSEEIPPITITPFIIPPDSITYPEKDVYITYTDDKYWIRPDKERKLKLWGRKETSSTWRAELKAGDELWIVEAGITDTAGDDAARQKSSERVIVHAVVTYNGGGHGGSDTTKRFTRITYKVGANIHIEAERDEHQKGTAIDLINKDLTSDERESSTLGISHGKLKRRETIGLVLVRRKGKKKGAITLHNCRVTRKVSSACSEGTTSSESTASFIVTPGAITYPEKIFIKQDGSKYWIRPDKGVTETSSTWKAELQPKDELWIVEAGITDVADTVAGRESSERVIVHAVVTYNDVRRKRFSSTTYKVGANRHIKTKTDDLHRRGVPFGDSAIKFINTRLKSQETIGLVLVRGEGANKKAITLHYCTDSESGTHVEPNACDYVAPADAARTDYFDRAAAYYYDEDLIDEENALRYLNRDISNLYKRDVIIQKKQKN